jgi:hypothetical protein
VTDTTQKLLPSSFVIRRDGGLIVERTKEGGKGKEAYTISRLRRIIHARKQLVVASLFFPSVGFSVYLYDIYLSFSLNILPVVDRNSSTHIAHTYTHD